MIRMHDGGGEKGDHSELQSCDVPTNKCDGTYQRAAFCWYNEWGADKVVDDINDELEVGTKNKLEQGLVKRVPFPKIFHVYPDHMTLGGGDQHVHLPDPSLRAVARDSSAAGGRLRNPDCLAMPKTRSVLAEDDQGSRYRRSHGNKVLADKTGWIQRPR